MDWVEERELLLASKGKAVKGNYVLIWAGKTGRMHINTWNLSAEQEANPSVLLRIFFF